MGCDCIQGRPRVGSLAWGLGRIRGRPAKLLRAAEVDQTGLFLVGMALGVRSARRVLTAWVGGARSRPPPQGRGLEIAR